MADQPYNRTPIYPLEKPLADDINQGFSQADRSLRDTMYKLLGTRNGFLFDSFLVSPTGPASLNVVIKAGVGYYDNGTDVPTAIGGVVGLDDRSRYKPIVLGADLTVAVPAPPGANSRIDLIEVAYNRLSDNSQSRQFLNPGTDTFAPAMVSKTLDFNVDGTLAYYAAAAVPTTALAYKSGVAGVSPVAPSVDAGYLPVAYVTVATGVVTIIGANIADGRAVLGGNAFLGRQLFTTNGTYTPTPGTRKVRVTMSGGGGGGAYCIGTATHANASSGGSSGVQMVFREQAAPGTFVTGGAIVMGSGGTGGNNVGPVAATAGGDCTIVVNGTTYTAKGGTAGVIGVAAAAAPGMVSGTAAVPNGSGPQSDFTAGGLGERGVGLDNGAGAFVNYGGNGGANGLGVGGTGGDPIASFDGGTGIGYGSGGGGGASNSGVGHKGGNGSSGVVIVEEWS